MVSPRYALSSVTAGACLVVILVLSPAPPAWSAAAQPAPFDKGDPALGKPLVEHDCVACHAARMGGDADRMYLRADHHVKTPQQLLAQVSYCNSQLNTRFFPDEEEDVAAYLNQRYYHFKP